MLSLASAFAYRLWGQQLLTAAMVPSAPFAAPPPLSAEDYERRDMWLARPDIVRDNPGTWLPAGVKAEPAQRPAAVFFVHPTTYLTTFKARWNMSSVDRESLALAGQFIRSQASALNAVGPIWAPKYRQAHFGAFLTDLPAASKALDAAYRDVDAAFSSFLKANPEGPIILAAHSQGSRHLMHLMHNRVAGTPLAGRIVAAYIVGWPISVEADLPALGLPGCTRRGEAGCIIGWQSFAEPSDTGTIVASFDRETGLAGVPRKGTHMLCINPLTGAPNGAAAESQNLGTLIFVDPVAQSRLVKGAVPARCDAKGFLMIGNAPDLGAQVLPGNNYHVYDYALFWANIRRDAQERLATYWKR